MRAKDRIWIISTMLMDGQRRSEANLVLSVAEVAPLQEISVRIPDIAAQACRVYPSPCTADDLPVPKVALQVTVVCEEKSRTTHER